MAEVTKDSGVEGRLEGVGTFYIIISIIALIVTLIISQGEQIKNTVLSTLWIAIGISFLAQGIIFMILFQAGAEVIRLLKKLNNLPYSGTISNEKEATVEVNDYTCSECGSVVDKNAKYCAACGVKLEE